MASEIDNQLRRQWARPRQTLRACVERRIFVIVLNRQHHCENNELAELCVAHHTNPELMLSRKTESAMSIRSVSNSLLMLIAGGIASLILTAAPACNISKEFETERMDMA